MSKPTVYDHLFPGRFLKAGLLLGKKVTLSIKDVDTEQLEGEDGKKQVKAILSFKETPMQHVMPKTNALCLKAMFGQNLADWVDKRITIFESTWNNEPCIRVWGSPDIEADMKVTIQLPRRRPFDMTLHAVKSKSQAQSQSEPLDPRIEAAFGVLGWDDEKKAAYLSENAALGQAGMAKDLNRIIDEAAA